MMSKGVHITNHARLRYLERVRHFPLNKLEACQGKNEYEKLKTLQEHDIVDIEEIDREILGSRPQRTIDQIKLLRTCLYPVGKFFLKVVNGTVITIFDEKNEGKFR